MVVFSTISIHEKNPGWAFFGFQVLRLAKLGLMAFMNLTQSYPDAPCMEYVPTLGQEWPHEQEEMYR